MNVSYQPDRELEKRPSNWLLDVFIRAGLILALVMLCYKIFAPFLVLMAWALILAITLYPLHSFIVSTNYPAPPLRAENYAAVSDHFKEGSRWAPVVSSEGPTLCSTNPPWSKASTDPHPIADRFNDKYSNSC